MKTELGYLRFVLLLHLHPSLRAAASKQLRFPIKNMFLVFLISSFCIFLTMEDIFKQKYANISFISINVFTRSR